MTQACFYCAIMHNFTTDKCECACHKVAPTWDKLEAIEKGLDWTIPQLIAIQKLLANVQAEATLEERESCALISEDEWKLDEHNDGHPEFYTKYGCVDVDDAIRKRVSLAQAVASAPKDS